MIDIDKIDKSLEEAALEYETDNTIQTYDGGGLSPMAVVGLAEAFEAGAEWQASQMPMPEDTVLFNKGVAEGRRLEREDMMDEGVEGEVVSDLKDVNYVRSMSKIPSWLYFGQKVRLIIVKEDEK